ncbi:cysteine-rich RLK (RECEPTOR-like protein kinase) 8 [Hibiscus trionum]|uniref:Cysteine-rich RLK (RECEPTOR-like protein kinase) 8 n=1 Tax=Hibiscus trionum TaxID=183268 RepID=A0A9W7J2U9_HIBTR|nr:cysteine-rich RLK (RECEPTOR-like protein kinase) 8 [Hibiscus trionum]
MLRSKEGTILSQRKYALELIADSGLGNAKVVSTPLEQNLKRHLYDSACEGTLAEGACLSDMGSYQRLVGRLLYLTNTRPDIAFAIQYLSQFMHKPQKKHYDAALRVVRYIKRDPGLGVLLSAHGEPSLVAFCDADWAACSLTRRSVTGFCVKLGHSLICWKSKKQSTVSRSSAEAEYRSMASATTEVVWLRGLLHELGFQQKQPTVLYSDSQPALQIASNPVFHERTKHIEIDCHFIREKIQNKVIQPQYVSTVDQQADILTKGLSVHQHGYLKAKLGVKNVFHPPT